MESTSGCTWCGYKISGRLCVSSCMNKIKTNQTNFNWTTGGSRPARSKATNRRRIGAHVSRVIRERVKRSCTRDSKVVATWQNRVRITENLRNFQNGGKLRKICGISTYTTENLRNEILKLRKIYRISLKLKELPDKHMFSRLVNIWYHVRI